MNTSFEEPFYNFIEYQEIKSVAIYHKFLNWLQGEFALCQNEQLEDLKVYYPGGFFTIKILSNKEGVLNTEIKVKSKSKKTGLKTYQTIASVYAHLIDIS